jgi:hypothetical protein
MERFEVKDSQGKVWHYLALTEGEPGALIFEDGKLSGKLSRRDAAAFTVAAATQPLPAVTGAMMQMHG